MTVQGAEQAGRANGIIARAQQVARAGGPVAAAALAESTSYRVVFAALAVLLLLGTGLTRTPRDGT